MEEDEETSDDPADHYGSLIRIRRRRSCALAVQGCGMEGTAV